MIDRARICAAAHQKREKHGHEHDAGWLESGEGSAVIWVQMQHGDSGHEERAGRASPGSFSIYIVKQKHNALQENEPKVLATSPHGPRCAGNFCAKVFYRRN